MTQVATIPESKTDELTSIMTVIERCALNPNVDVDKMQKLLDMQERILDRNAKQAFSMDFVRMKSELPKIARTKNNNQTKSKYAALEDINKIIDPVLNKFGFGTSHKISQDDKHISVTAILWHRDGHTEQATITLPLDKAGIQGSVNKTDVHAIASSTTYGKRLAICALLNLSTGDEVDDDGNGAGSDAIATPAQQKAIESLTLRLPESSLNKFFAAYPDFKQIKKSEVNTIIARLNKTLSEVKNA